MLIHLCQEPFFSSLFRKCGNEDLNPVVVQDPYTNTEPSAPLQQRHETYKLSIKGKIWIQITTGIGNSMSPASQKGMVAYWHQIFL